jgi:asparagine synthase (glutamine-hydrolysing)
VCGITGLFYLNGMDPDFLRQVNTRMTETLRHRGPDASGIWLDPNAGIALGHRRLSILDISPEGHQPMVSACGRYVITFNGEIYNFLALRRELESKGQAPQFRGNSDTEVMLAAISSWGLKRAMGEFIGMFAFALWDRKERCLHLVRDRVGIKPLYYGWAGRAFVFGSELKALRAHPDFGGQIHRDALALYFRDNCIPAPYSIYDCVFKLQPGHFLTISERRVPTPQKAPLKSEAYWSAREIWTRGAGNQWKGTEDEAADTLETLLRNSIDLQMISDVPLGAFLSGGIDSSTVVALMQSKSSRPVKTFTIGFHNDYYNEARHAKRVARHLGTDHTELYITDDDARMVIPGIPQMYDEPFADSSQIPTFLVSKLTREQVTVALSGDGGDELFSGYSKYYSAVRFWRLQRRIPLFAKTLLIPLVKKTPDYLLDALGFALNPIIAAMGFRPGSIGDRLHRFADRMSGDSFMSFYQVFTSLLIAPTEHVLGAEEPQTIPSSSLDLEARLDRYQLMSYLDFVSYLPDDILVKVDRASMAVGLEARLPVLDHRVVEFAAGVPSESKWRNGKGKWLLRQVLKRYVPEELTDRPKTGFGVPVEAWLRGPLRNWAEDLLDKNKLASQGYLANELVQKKWAEHSHGSRNWSSYLWAVLMFQSWLTNQ